MYDLTKEQIAAQYVLVELCDYQRRFRLDKVYGMEYDIESEIDRMEENGIVGVVCANYCRRMLCGLIQR